MNNRILDRTPTPEAIEEARKNKCSFLMLGHGRFALLDLEDWDRIHHFKWHYNPRGYAARLQFRGGGKCDELIYLHREIVGAGRGIIYDHINRNRLDCRRCNLRLATPHQNAGNSGKRKQVNQPTSQFKGVSFDREKQRWLAQGRDHGRMVFLGRFKQEQDAALAYNAWSKTYFGEFAFQNEIAAEIEEVLK